MPTDIILSIKPKYAEMILQGTKTVELRKSLPKEMPGKVYLYATKPVGRIVGWFTVRAMERMQRNAVMGWRIWEFAKLAYFDYCSYIGTRKYVWFFTVKEVHGCDLPLPRGVKPPRNFVYLKEPCASCLCWDFPGCKACLRVKEEA